MRCDQPNCKETALGWRTLSSGGSVRVGTCDTHTKKELLARLAPVEVTKPQPEPKKV